LRKVKNSSSRPLTGRYLSVSFPHVIDLNLRSVRAGITPVPMYK
jgi:hypothetical protein